MESDSHQQDRLVRAGEEVREPGVEGKKKRQREEDTIHKSEKNTKYLGIKLVRL